MARVIRRVFTLVSVLAVALLFTARLMGEGDPRYLIFGIGIILHPEYRMAIRLPSGATWAFSYSALYFPLLCCFLASVAWNVVDWLRRHPRPRRSWHPHCRRCNYDLTGNISGQCPECGMAIPLNAEAGA